MMSDETMTSAAQKSKNPAVYIVVLNWNGWADTIECLESVFRSDYPNFKVIVCDNGSADESLAMIKTWANGDLDAVVDLTNPLRHLSMPPISKPVRYHEYDRRTAEEGGQRDEMNRRLLLIQTGENLGFAGGCNVGLRYALAKDDLEYVWLLNNDTVVQPDALRHLVERVDKAPQIGICGSTIVYYDRPNTIQRLGGATYNKWLGISSGVGRERPIGAFASVEQAESQLSYVSGASMLVRKTFLKEIGLMDEDYFLYFEELDWSMRSRDRFQLGYAGKSKVFHKEGSSIGSHSDPTKISAKAEFFMKRNRLRFTRKYCWYCLPTVYLMLLVALLDRVRIGRIDSALLYLKLMMRWR